MRPLRLELEGFFSFRERTLLDFEGLELFALTGQTGAGKSSLIDAMVFALYGAVPRLANSGKVAPVITQGANEARVALTFRVAGADYVATRVVRRTASGASTKEARLERAGAGVGSLLAGNERDLTARVSELLGLSFAHFTRCVVLPQGEFARFLHEAAGERQELLAELLDLGVYRAVREDANSLVKEREQRQVWLLRELDGRLAGATREAEAAMGQRLAQLRDAAGLVAAAEAQQLAAVAAARQASDERAAAEARAGTLGALVVPPGIGELAQAATAARAAVTAAQAALEAAERALAEAEAAAAALPAGDELSRLLALRQREQALAASRQQQLTALAQASATATQAAAALLAAEERHRLAVAAAVDLRRRHAAADLAHHLVPGEPCPVCAQTVVTLPSPAAPTDLAAADHEASTAQAALAVARRDAASADTAAELAAGRAADLERDLLVVTAGLAGVGPLAELEQLRARLADVERRVASGREAARAARQRLTLAERAAAEQSGAEAHGWAAFDAARDRLAKLDPPALDRRDLADAWQLLAGWAATRAGMERAAALRLQQTAAAAQVEAAMVAGQLRELAGALAVELDPRRSVAAAVEAAIGRAEGELAALHRAIAEAGEKREEQMLARREGEVARELWKQLHSDRFERWLLQQALARLAAGASRILEQLSRGQYGLALAGDNNFDVVDHANADERRSARTLSGGETFLASLSLALALADDVAELATRGAARLDALFLDEGFGTLDQETLEVVEATLATLGARGRMVGVVTHVRELAERLPVRFLVHKDARGSTVERDEA